MNSYNCAFKKRTDKAAMAISYLIKMGCAITSMEVNENRIVIEILPPTNPKVKGTLVTINNTNNGRHYIMVKRMYGCTVQWKTHNHQEVVA